MTLVTIEQPSVTVAVQEGAAPIVSLGPPATAIAVDASVPAEVAIPAAQPAVSLFAPIPTVTLDVPTALGGGGQGVAPVEAVTDDILAAGMPVALSRANGHFRIADAGNKPLAFVAGLASAATAAGFVADAEREALTLADWTAVTGSALLAQGQPYFLAAGGGLTTTPPSSPNCLVVVGTASSSTTMLIEPQSPIQL